MRGQDALSAERPRVYGTVNRARCGRRRGPPRHAARARARRHARTVRRLLPRRAVSGRRRHRKALQLAPAACGTRNHLYSTTFGGGIMTDSFKARTTLKVGGAQYEILSLEALKARNVGRLPFSLKILLENLLRFEDGVNVTKNDIDALLQWDPKAQPSHEIAFTPARVIMQDFTGVPCIVDLAAMREAIVRLGGDPQRVNPLAPAELVIDHSVQVDEYGAADSLQHNNEIEFQRNGERYMFLRWGQNAFSNFKVVPPNTGIVHQVNIERLARVIFADDSKGEAQAYPDTLVGTDSHTTMVNGLGVLGWGVGGIEAEAAMLGQPVTMLIPQVIGFKLVGALPAGTTATDLVLTVTEMLRKV